MEQEKGNTGVEKDDDRMSHDDEKNEIRFKIVENMDCFK